MSDLFYVSKVRREADSKGNVIFNFLLTDLEGRYSLKSGSSLCAYMSLDRAKNDWSLGRYYDDCNGDLTGLSGKYFMLSMSVLESENEITDVWSLDVVAGFKKELDKNAGKDFFTSLSVYNLLVYFNREVNSDGSISLNYGNGDLCVVSSRNDSGTICGCNIDSNEILTIKNIEKIFEKFYENVDLPPYSEGNKSYYSIQYNPIAIIRKDHYLKVSYRMTTEDDHDYWRVSNVLCLGDALSVEQTEYLKSL